MSRRLSFHIFIFYSWLMFSTTLNHLKVKTTSPSQRESLVNLLKNAEKQAKTDERILFLTKCRKKKYA